MDSAVSRFLAIFLILLIGLSVHVILLIEEASEKNVFKGVKEPIILSVLVIVMGILIQSLLSVIFKFLIINI